MAGETMMDGRRKFDRGVDMNYCAVMRFWRASMPTDGSARKNDATVLGVGGRLREHSFLPGQPRGSRGGVNDD